MSVTVDLHYHTNVFSKGRQERQRRLEAHRDALSTTGVDYVASTEHVYKRPLDAYLYLADATADQAVTIIPGVEWLSKEGVDLIFLFRTEADLRQGLVDLTPYSHPVADAPRLKADLGALCVIPHPFTPGKTGLASTLGEGAYFDLLPEMDYVEVHNGLSLNFLDVLRRRPELKRGNWANSDRGRAVQYSYRLPDDFRGADLGTGWAVSSDAHYPGHQYVVGGIDAGDFDHDDWFASLGRRLRFRRTWVQEKETCPVKARRKLISNSYCVVGEALNKFVRRQVA